MPDIAIWGGIGLVIVLLCADAFDAVRKRNRNIAALVILAACVVSLMILSQG